ncbi:TPA: hypothetical protein ACGE3O_003742, partial [Acinetobacter baumannii]
KLFYFKKINNFLNTYIILVLKIFLLTQPIFMFKNVIKNNRIFYFVDFEYIYKPAVSAVTNYTT